MVTSGEHYIFQRLTAVTTVVQRSFGKLLRVSPTSIIVALWLLRSPSGCRWADAAGLCVRVVMVVGDIASPGYAKRPATRPDGQFRDRDLPFAHHAIPAGRSGFRGCACRH